MSEDKRFQPHNVILRTAGYDGHLSRQMGIIDFDQGWGNQFAQYKAITKLIKNSLVSIKNKTLKTSKEFELNRQSIDKIDRIWNGICYYGIYRSPKFRRVFFFEDPRNPNPIFDSTKQKLAELEEDEFELEVVIDLPKLKNLVPVGEISMESWGIQVRQDWYLRYAWEGVNYATIVNDGNFKHYYSEGLIPKFERHHMGSLAKTTYIFSRRVYFALIDDYENFFNDLWADVQDDFQKIIDFNEVGEDEEPEEEGTDVEMMAKVE